MKRLFVSDLDGTLLNQYGEVSEKTAEILNEAIAKGLDFTISTARTPTTALQIVEPLNLRLPIMMMNGVLIYDMATKRYLRKETMDATIVMVILGMIKTRGLDCFLYALDEEQVKRKIPFWGLRPSGEFTSKTIEDIKKEAQEKEKLDEIE